MKNIPILLLLIFLSSCRLMPLSIPKSYNGDIAYISDSYTNLKTNHSAHFFYLKKVDNKGVLTSEISTRQAHIGKGRVFTPKMMNVKIMTIKQKFTIAGNIFYPTDAQGLFSDDLGVIKDIVFTPVKGENYIVKGVLEKNNSKVWLEDSRGNKIVSEQK